MKEIRGQEMKVVCSSGVRFGTEKKELEKESKKKNNTERTQFSRVCPAYGLSPDFYLEGCLTAGGEFMELVSLKGPFATLRSLDGGEMIVPFEEAMDMIIKHLEFLSDDVPGKVHLLGLEGDAANKATSESKEAIKNRKTNAKRAKSIWNGNMEDISSAMGIPLFAGWTSKDTGKLYEFVSFREDLEHPYIVECLDTSADDPDRFKEISFNSLLNGIRMTAGRNNDLRMLSYLENAVPACQKQPEIRQQTIFDYNYISA